MHMQYFEDKPCEKSCMILMKGARESIEWVKKGNTNGRNWFWNAHWKMSATFWKEGISKKAAADAAAYFIEAFYFVPKIRSPASPRPGTI